MNKHLMSVLMTLGVLGFSAPSAYAQFFGTFDVPEPGVLALFAIGGVAMGLIEWRKRRGKK